MSFEITGRLAEKFDTQKVSDRFQKREFVLEIKSTGNTGYEFVDFIKFQATQDKCSMLDQVSIDEELKVSFNLRGRKWERDGQVSYFTNLEAWRVEKVQNVSNNPSVESSAPVQDGFTTQDAPFPTQPPQEDDSGVDDLPF
ncbi:MAG: DUF3127 domain-containing protein [Bacteroidetes bacterium]|nr:DUF3127 domain-containing protein [Bacteroidota bacterium]